MQGTGAATDTKSLFDFDRLFDLPDPYPIFAELRRNNPVARFDLPIRTLYAVSRYDDVAAVLHDAETYSSEGNAQVQAFMGRTIVVMDGEEHARHRALLGAMFVPRVVEALRPFIDSVVHGLIDRFASAGSADLVAELATPFPIQVIAHMIGIPREDYPTFARWSLDLVGFRKDATKATAASENLYQYLLPIVRRRRAEPSDDLMSRLLGQSIDGHGLSDGDVINFLRLLIPAGAETTSRLIGNMLYALIVDPARFERVLADRSLVPWVVEETLRWETPVLFVARQTTRDVTIRGVDVPRDTMVVVMMGSANRDGDHFPDPDRFDLDRRAEDHLSFAAGRHFCLGYHLARLEARAAVSAVLDRMRCPRFDPSAPTPAIVGLAFRSPQALPVCFDAVAS